jgi:hypothetical protein
MPDFSAAKLVEAVLLLLNCPLSMYLMIHLGNPEQTDKSVRVTIIWRASGIR